MRFFRFLVGWWGGGAAGSHINVLNTSVVSIGVTYSAVAVERVRTVAGLSTVNTAIGVE
jgi:hypothetical protein